MFLESKGYVFESETDTECIAKLVKHIRSQNPSYTFRQLVEQTISQVRVLISSRLCLFLTYFLLLSSRVPLPVSSSRSSTLENVWQPGRSRRSSTIPHNHNVFFRRGSPLLVGIKAEGLESDSIPVQYSQEDHPKTYAHIPADLDPTSSPLIPRKKTSAMFRVDSDHVCI